MKKLKVIQLVPELNSGGVERGTLEVGRYLSENGHQSIIISNGGRMVEQLIREGSRHVKFPVHKKNPISLLQVPKLRKFFLREKPDIIHARSRIPAWLSYLTLMLINRGKRPNFVTTVHGFYSVNAYSKVMTQSDHVICVSNSIREYVLRNYPQTPQSKLSVIHRGIKSRDYHIGYKPKREWLDKWKEDFPKTTNKRILVLPGRLTRLKGQEEFLKIINILGDEYCGLIIGHVDKKKNGYFNELHALANKMGILKRILFLGHRDDLKDIFAISNCVFSLSTKPESFGRTVLEALSIGVPVIGYGMGGVGEILSELFPEGQVACGDILHAVELVKSLEKHPVKPKPNKTFTLEDMLAKIEDVYARLSC